MLPPISLPAPLLLLPLGCGAGTAFAGSTRAAYPAAASRLEPCPWLPLPFSQVAGGSAGRIVLLQSASAGGQVGSLELVPACLAS